jgi:hypothetical protein
MKRAWLGLAACIALALTRAGTAASQRRLARTVYPGACCGPGELARVILAGPAPQARRPM